MRLILLGFGEGDSQTSTRHPQHPPALPWNTASAGRVSIPKMPGRVLRVAAAAAAAVAAAAAAAGAAGAAPPSGAAARAAVLADVLATCQFDPSMGTFPVEALWQSGNTLEALSNAMLAAGSTEFAPLLAAAYLRTAPVLDTCFDDHQWWLLAWVRAYQAVGDPLYLQRAGQIFDFVAAQGWTDAPCGGGVLWCPPPTSAYKNAVTNELFITAAMELAPYEAALGKPSGFYVGWASKAWSWLESSGMIGADGLINDGLDGTTCANNNGTTWTYNQGVLLDGLALLSAATGNASIAGAAESVARATFALLTSGGVLVEPCGGGCDGDQHIFKGVFVRHLAKMAAIDTAFAPEAGAFLAANAAAAVANASCSGSNVFGLDWRGPCTSPTVATTSAALDLLTAAAAVAPPPALAPGAAAPWTALGPGTCVDAGNGNATAPACVVFGVNVTEGQCAAAAAADPSALAYEFQVQCSLVDKFNLCRVRSPAAAPGACPAGWAFQAGTGGTAVTGTVPGNLTLCVVRG
jgi:predicted alpha-1,6-mannanase (GH76 family)